jgi:hypothetical protein
VTGFGDDLSQSLLGKANRRGMRTSLWRQFIEQLTFDQLHAFIRAEEPKVAGALELLARPLAPIRQQK